MHKRLALLLPVLALMFSAAPMPKSHPAAIAVPPHVLEQRASRSEPSSTTTSSTTTMPPTTTTSRPPTTTTRPRVHVSATPVPPNYTLMLLCIRGPWHGSSQESNGNYGDNTGNGFYGAYQFSQSTWNGVASAIGRPDLVGTRASSADAATQDMMALALYHRNESRPTSQWPMRGSCFHFPLAA